MDSARTGKVKEVLGAVTGDRRTEGRGRTEERVADPCDPAQSVTDEAVDGETQAVREDHQDLPEGAR